MAKYPSITLTNAGLNMIAQSQGGTALIFTKIQLGDGTVSGGQDLKTLTALINPLLTANISSIDTTTTAGQATLTTVVSNSTVTTGFFARELGVFAKVGSGGAEQLFAYTNAGNYTDYMPDSSTPVNENQIKITLVVGNASSVSAVINGSIVYTTLAQVDAEISIHNNLSNAHSAAIGQAVSWWQASHAYSVGDIIHTRIYGSYKRMECVVAGTTGTSEPSWTSVGILVTDGSVTWIVDDIRDGTPVGRIIPDYVLRQGYIKANGGLYSRTAYPRLFKFATDNGLIVPEATWAAGRWFMFGAGDGSTTFRMPDWRAENIRFLDDGRGVDIVTVTGNTTSGSNQITSVSNVNNACVGESITGTGIPAGATITAVAGTTVTISANATATATGITMTLVRSIGSFEDSQNLAHIHSITSQYSYAQDTPALYPYIHIDLGDGSPTSNYLSQTSGGYFQSVGSSGGSEARIRSGSQYAVMRY